METTEAPGLASASGKMEAFTFGDAMPVLDRRELLDYVECGRAGKWYEPPVSWEGLAKAFRASTHHSSSIYFKGNALVSTFKPHKLLSAETSVRWCWTFSPSATATWSCSAVARARPWS